MANLIRLEIVTPDRNLLSEDVEYVGAPGVSGEFGVLHNHTPFLTALSIGSLFYKKEGRKYFVFVSGGFTEVTPTKVSILAEVAEKADEISIERARKAKERAEQRLQQEKEQIDYARAKAAMARAMHRLRCRDDAVSAGTCSM
ncbi:ATP synthase F1, epsilon subunit [Desulfonatronospira thiodismutans ASO3-1]|uniref:ATP synthase epsilon chain n=1 Tax=Desulfonatronospira thiodismutans ASO3-1 TaxID=555779 RepID=D6SSC7_9BACT|nr:MULTISPECIES: F0F1 ATP synthase subunit epsilon [Desulfonatronospira]EFI33593.1 ATP synthase F1, epsilon subunit [Desulfonatronospira thiodismutans ASO3-1]RQD73709.1 MAG: F0F1 ATP synthase subunit epsilon [Desulfonatronospira sp. MSAO_Bac3]